MTNINTRKDNSSEADKILAECDQILSEYMNIVDTVKPGNANENEKNKLNKQYLDLNDVIQDVEWKTLKLFVHSELKN